MAHMTTKTLLLTLVSLVVTLPLRAQTNGAIEPSGWTATDGMSAASKHSETAIEPNAGKWRTWVISSGKDYRVPPPPGPGDTKVELRSLAELISLGGHRK